MTAAPRILVVDDEIGFRELCTDLLSETGYQTDTAVNGKAALELLAEADYQLVLSDINMPVMDGLELLKEAKDRHPSLEVILMTAYGGLQSAVEALRLGAYDYITKPFTRDLLLATVRRCLEKQRLAHELRFAQDQLIRKEKLATLGAMSGWLAHRMRNPLNVILMCSQYLKAKFSEEDERREVASAIEDKVKVLEKMTRDFIEFSRTYEPRFKVEDLHRLLDDVLEAFASRIKIQEVELTKSYAAESPILSLDRDLMDEVFGYLFDNALEAMEGAHAEGARPADAAANGARELAVRTGVEEGAAYVEISNSGPLVAEDLRGRLFEPFFTTKERGTGLGLAICRRVIESHGGSIVLADGARTTFRVQLPREQKKDLK